MEDVAAADGEAVDGGDDGLGDLADEAVEGLDLEQAGAISPSSPSRMWCSGGHHVPMPSVNTLKARSIGASTTTEWCTEVSAAEMLMFPPPLAVVRPPQRQ